MPWPHREPHRRPQWRRPHAFAPPVAAFRGPRGDLVRGSGLVLGQKLSGGGSQDQTSQDGG
eukprot:6269982-Pyramimonas_sp.AAC.1